MYTNSVRMAMTINNEAKCNKEYATCSENIYNGMIYTPEIMAELAKRTWSSIGHILKKWRWLKQNLKADWIPTSVEAWQIA